MLGRLSEERGQGMIELILAAVLITVALLALMASYDSAFVSLHKSARTNAAAALANSQLELYTAVYGDTSATTTTTGGTTTTITLPLAQVGLSSSLLATAKANDTYYSSDESALSPTGSDATSSTCTTTIPQC
jgi:Tfp pilus assembly protein PilE